MENTSSDQIEKWAEEAAARLRALYLRLEQATPEWVRRLIQRGAAWYWRVQKKASVTLPWKMVQFWMAPLLIGLMVALFYAPPMVLPLASIHWDAADIHYPLQHYFAERIRIGIPFWTPYVFSGYPILANPEMQAWYPLNWPFYLVGFHPGSVEAELALHAFLACLGAYLFLYQLRVRSSAAMLGGLAYGLSGFFAGHSSHVPIFMSAAWLPWLLWAYRRAADLKAAANIAGGALAGGCLILAGYYQMSVLCFLGLFCYAAADVWSGRIRTARAGAICTGMLAGALALSAIQVLPAAELIAQSVPDPPNVSNENLHLRSLATLLYPNAAGAISARDKGFITDHYLYAGLLILPLALIGAVRLRRQPHAYVLAGFAFWYMLGPWAGLYWLGAALPGKILAGPPDLGWFLAALVLAWLAALGSDFLCRRLPIAGVLLVGIFFADLWYWNLLQNPLAFARNSFDALYGEAEQRAGRILAAPLLPLTRFDAPAPLSDAGPILSPLDIKLETTYGYFVLQPRAYKEYRAAMKHNRKLIDGLNVSRFLDPLAGQLVDNPNALPRAYFPRSIREVPDEAGSRQWLETADPAAGSTILGAHLPFHKGPIATPFVASFDEQSYRIHYTASSPSLLKLSVTWYPGWRAHVDGAEAPVLRVDHALMGVVVPAGEHAVEFRFYSNWFTIGFVISLLSLIGLPIMAGGLDAYVWSLIRMKRV